jgi:N-acetylglucosamine kinase-like BadF-type ATPase
VSFVIGVDGGGTRTRAVILDDGGRELGRGVAEGAVATARAPSKACTAVAAAVHAAAAEASVSLPGSFLWAGLAGAGADEAREAVRSLLRGAELARNVVVGTDVEAAFHDAFPEGAGVLLIAGTGSIALARTEDGSMRRAGGWGRLLGDEGSGYGIGLDGLRLVTRAADGRAPATVLTDRLLSECGLHDAKELVAWVDAAEKSDVAALAPIVVSAADRGDAGAMAVVEAGVGELVALVRAASADRSCRVVRWGGLVAGEGPLGPRVDAALERDGYTRLDRTVDPALGAALLAAAHREPAAF